jgi:hypothetical protein
MFIPLLNTDTRLCKLLVYLYVDIFLIFKEFEHEICLYFLKGVGSSPQYFFLVSESSVKGYLGAEKANSKYCWFW